MTYTTYNMYNTVYIYNTNTVYIYNTLFFINESNSEHSFAIISNIFNFDEFSTPF